MGRVAAVPLGAAAGLIISACFVKPDGPSGSVDPDGNVTSHDGIPGIDGAISCPMRDNFDLGAACGAWGSDVGSGSHIVTRSQGQLLFYTTSNEGGSAACQGMV